MKRAVTPLRRTAPFRAVAVAACAVVAGCGAPGAPDPQDDAVAPGAPIRVPSVGAAGDRKLDEVQPAIKKKVKEQCGGKVCVNLVVKHVDSADQLERAGFGQGNGGYCGFRETVPRPGQTVQQGKTIYIIAGTGEPRPCGVEETVLAETGTATETGGGSGSPSEVDPSVSGDSPSPEQDSQPTEGPSPGNQDGDPGQRPEPERDAEPEPEPS
ncbi:hypothetical protein [Spirillospora sp. NPDC029432]|uniref:hypothetical protein n=1 Tax=Spirillospora sp. NPDC029432 TaxID=3154599 RepID=UPI0034521AAA